MTTTRSAQGGGRYPVWAGPVFGAVVTAVAAQLSLPVPGSPVPQSLQTLAVVVVGGVLGPMRGVAAMLVYVALGAVGLPVFADGAAGADRLLGPTGGYLVGFVGAAGVVGWWMVRLRAAPRGRWRLAASATVVMAGGHLLILTLGWARLALLLGAGEAFAQGVAPFLWGGAVKSLAGAVLVVALRPVEPDPPPV